MTTNPTPAVVERRRDVAMAALASLRAAISLLERGGKKAAPSDLMFAQMLLDYHKAADDSAAYLASPAPVSKPVTVSGDELLAWLSAQHRLSLEYYSPVYGADDDQSREWRVTRESGSINDREFDIVGRGVTAAAAIADARAALASDRGEVAAQDAGEVKRLREALKRIVDAPLIDHSNPSNSAQNIARAALKEAE